VAPVRGDRAVRRRIGLAGLACRRIAGAGGCEAGSPRAEAGSPRAGARFAPARVSRVVEIRPPCGGLTGSGRSRHCVSATRLPDPIQRGTRGRAPAPRAQDDEGGETRQRDDQQAQRPVPPSVPDRHLARRQRAKGGRRQTRGGHGTGAGSERAAERSYLTAAGRPGPGYVRRARPLLLGMYVAGVGRRGRLRGPRNRKRRRSSHPDGELLNLDATPPVEHCRILPCWARPGAIGARISRPRRRPGDAHSGAMAPPWRPRPADGARPATRL
jgi:hypothetical protein